MAFATVDEAIEDFKNGKMVVVVDDEDRENEGDVIAAAETLTPEQMNFMATYAKGMRILLTPVLRIRLSRWLLTIRIIMRRHLPYLLMHLIRKPAYQLLNGQRRYVLLSPMMLNHPGSGVQDMFFHLGAFRGAS